MINNKDKTIIVLLTFILILSLILYDRIINVEPMLKTSPNNFTSKITNVKNSLKTINTNLIEIIKNRKIDTNIKKSLIKNFRTVTFTTQDICNKYYSVIKVVGSMDINNYTASVSNSFGLSFENINKTKKLTQKEIKMYIFYQNVVDNWLKCFERVEKSKEYTGLKYVYAILEGMTIYSRGIDIQYLYSFHTFDARGSY